MLTTVLEVVGLALIVAGIVGLALVLWPAAAVLAGLACVAVSWWVQRR